MGQYECHVFVCTSGETCPQQGDVEGYVKTLRAGAQKAGRQVEVRIEQCGRWPLPVRPRPDDRDLSRQCLVRRGAGVRPGTRDPQLPHPRGTARGAASLCSGEARRQQGRPREGAVGAAPSAAVPLPRRPGSASAAHSRSPMAASSSSPSTAPAWSWPAPGKEVFACQAVCPHEAVSLEDGVHDGATLTCLEHMWQFDLRTGAPMGDATSGVTTYRLKEEIGEVYVDLG